MPRWPRSLALLLLLLLLPTFLHFAAALYPLPGELPGDNPVPNPGDKPQKPPPEPLQSPVPEEEPQHQPLQSPHGKPPPEPLQSPVPEEEPQYQPLQSPHGKPPPEPLQSPVPEEEPQYQPLQSPDGKPPPEPLHSPDGDGKPQQPSPPTGPKASEPLGVIAICAKTEFPDVCLSAAQSADPSVPLDKADALTVLKLQAKDMMTSLSSFTSVAKSLMATSKPEDKEKLDSCLGYFDLGVSKLQNASTAKEASGIMESVYASQDSWSMCCVNAFDEECPPQLRDLSQAGNDRQSSIIGVNQAFWPSTTTKPDAQYDSYLFLAAHSPIPHLSETWSKPLGVKEICSKANFPDICQSSVSSVATGPLDKADALTVLLLQVKAMVAGLTAAMEKARSQPGDPKYKECASQYGPSLNRLLHVNGSKTIGGVKGFLDEAVSIALACCDSYYNDGQKDCPFGDAEESLIKQKNNTVATLFTFWPEAKREIASAETPPPSVAENLYDPAPPGGGEWLDPFNLADVCSQCKHANVCINSIRNEANDKTLLKVDPPFVVQLLFNKLKMHLTIAKMEAEKLVNHPRTKDPLKSKILPNCIKMYEKATSKIEKGNSTEDIGEAWRYMDDAGKDWKACCHEKGEECPQCDRYDSLELFRAMIDQIVHTFWPQVPLSPDYKAPPSSKGSGGGLKAAAWDRNIKIRRA